MPRPSFRPPEEEPAIPIEPDVAKARATYVKAQVERVKAMKEAGKSA